MTRKDYVLIAKALASTKPEPAFAAENPNGYAHRVDQWHTTRDALLHALQSVEPRFDADRFRDATNA